MTDAVSLKPDLGRFGVWTFGAPKPEQAVEIEKLGYGAVWIGGSPAGDLNYVEPDPRADRDASGRHRHRQRLDGADAEEVAEAYHRIEDAYPGRFLLGIGIGHPGAHRGVPQALRRAGRVPGRARRREGADQPAGRRRAGAEGAQAGGPAQRGRAPVPDHAGAHRPGARIDRQHGVSGARAQGGADHGCRRRRGRSAARPSTST